MDDNISKIKDKVDVVDLIGGYLKLNKAGVNYKARCPFHNEKTGSFFVSPERQIWHCFGCGAGGDVFGFVKQIEGVEFPEALRILAAKAGVELKSFRTDPALQSNKNKLYEISEIATKFFQKQLYESPQGKNVLKYLKDRGLNDESIEKFRLGYAPSTWNSLGNFLARNFELKNISEAGLLAKKDSGGYFDKFRSRIMFPVFDLNNQVVGFAGRIFATSDVKGMSTSDVAKYMSDVKGMSTSDVAKYMNTPQTAIYDKSRVLYGMNFAKLGIRQKNKALMVEGNMDVIMAHQAGATHTIASSGTAMTMGHLQIIKRYTDNIDLCFDADSAGNMATERGVDLALARGFNIGIISLDEKDPADYVKAHGNADFAEKSQPFMEYFFGAMQKSVNLTTAIGKKTFSKNFLPFVASLSNRIEQAHWVQEVASVLRTKEDIVRAELASVKPRTRYEDEGSDSQPEKKPDEPLDIFHESILSILAKKPELKASLTSTDLALLPEPNEMQANFIAMKAEEFWKDFDDKQLEDELMKLLNMVKRRNIVAKLESLEYEIKEAEREGDKARLATLVSSFAKTSGEL